MTSDARTSTPWSRADLRAACLLALVAIALPAWAWRAASGTGDVAEQTGPLAVAILGAVASVSGAARWIVAGRHAVSTWRGGLLDRIDDELTLHEEPTTEPSSERGVVVVVVPGSVRYHHRECLLVRGKPVDRFEAPTAAAEGRKPCEMCLP